MITVKNLHKYYRMKKGKTFHALKGLNIQFPNKGFVFVAGKSGCGKSTLLNVIGGLDTYEKGDLIVEHRSTKKFSAQDMDNYRNSYLGFIFQDFHLIDGETIYDNVALALKLQGYSKEKIPARVKHYLKIVDLYDKRNNKISEISGGQKQRVAIARALIKNPQVIIADEPTGNLDSKTGYLIMRILKKLSKTKLVIMVTHDMDYADEFADRLIQLKDGRIISDYDSSDLDYKRKGKLRFKRSKFPLNVAFKMAWTSVIRKKFRLLFTVLLFAISIGLFSFTTSFNFYKTEDLFYQYIVDSNSSSIKFSEGRNDRWEMKNLLDEQNVDILKQRYPDVTFGRFGDFLFNVQNCGFDAQLCNTRGETAFVESVENLGLNIIHGNSNFTSDSTIISDIQAAYIINGTDYNSYQDLIGVTSEELTEAGVTTTLKGSITGIYQSGALDELKTIDQEIKIGSFNDYQKIQSFRNHYNYAHIDKDTYVETYSLNGQSNYEGFIYFATAEKTLSDMVGTLPQNNDEAVLSINGARQYIEQMTSYYVSDGTISEIARDNIYSKYNYDVCYSYLEAYDLNECTEVMNEVLIDINNNFDVDGSTFLLEITPEAWSRTTYEQVILDTISIERITGISLDGPDLVVRPTVLDNYIQERTIHEGTYFYNTHNILAIFGGNAQRHEGFIKLVDKEYTHNTDASMALNLLDGFLNPTVMRTFLIISLVLGGFASLLMFSYINQSIRFKRADIGTLRAIGAKGIDVGKIFVTEALIISLISSVFAVIGLVYAVSQLNGIVDQSLDLSFNFFYINWMVYIILLLFAAIIALISCILPLTRLVKMSPIDVIRKARD